MRGLVDRGIQYILAFWLTIGLIVAVFTSNIGWNSIHSKKGIANTLLSVVVWPIPAGAELCRNSPTDYGINCGGFHSPFSNNKLPFKITRTNGK